MKRDKPAHAALQKCAIAGKRIHPVMVDVRNHITRYNKEQIDKQCEPRPLLPDQKEIFGDGSEELMRMVEYNA